MNAALSFLQRVEKERYAAFVALAILTVVSALLSPFFLQWQNLLNIIRQVSYTGIIALGMPFVIVSGGIDLAVGSNSRVALYSAIDVDTTRLAAYTVTGAMVGVSSVLISMRFNSVGSSTLGVNYELDAIAAVIIGGTSMSGGRGTVWGTVVGAITLGVINNTLNMVGISPYLQGTVKGLVIIGAVFIQRQRQ